MSENNYRIEEESIELSLKIIECYKYLYAEKEYVMSKQMLRSWTSIGANIHEAQQWSSKRDFLYKMNLSLKEAYETKYWLDVLERSWYLSKFNEKYSLEKKITEILKVLSSIVKSTKESLNP